jgi:hypothetical protein
MNLNINNNMVPGRLGGLLLLFFDYFGLVVVGGGRGNRRKKKSCMNLLNVLILNSGFNLVL